MSGWGDAERGGGRRWWAEDARIRIRRPTPPGSKGAGATCGDETSVLHSTRSLLPSPVGSISQRAVPLAHLDVVSHWLLLQRLASPLPWPSVAPPLPSADIGRQGVVDVAARRGAPPPSPAASPPCPHLVAGCCQSRPRRQPAPRRLPHPGRPSASA